MNPIQRYEKTMTPTLDKLSDDQIAILTGVVSEFTFNTLHTHFENPPVDDECYDVMLQAFINYILDEGKEGLGKSVGGAALNVFTKLPQRLQNEIIDALAELSVKLFADTRPNPPLTTETDKLVEAMAQYMLDVHALHNIPLEVENVS